MQDIKQEALLRCEWAAHLAVPQGGVLAPKPVGDLIVLGEELLHHALLVQRQPALLSKAKSASYF